MVGSIDPRCETVRGIHWPKKGREVVWSSRRGKPSWPAVQSDRINRPDIWMQAIRSDPEKLLRHGGRPHMGPGADQTAMMTETTRSTAVITIDCHRKIVSENGMTPVMGNRLLGRLAAFACSCAADDDSPIAQVAPSPKYAAAAAAR